MSSSSVNPQGSGDVSKLIKKFEEEAANLNKVGRHRGKPITQGPVGTKITDHSPKAPPKSSNKSTSIKAKLTSPDDFSKTDQAASEAGIKTNLQKLRDKSGGKIPPAPKRVSPEEKLVDELEKKFKTMKESSKLIDQTKEEIEQLEDSGEDVSSKEDELIQHQFDFIAAGAEANKIENRLKSLQKGKKQPPQSQEEKLIAEMETKIEQMKLASKKIELTQKEHAELKKMAEKNKDLEMDVLYMESEILQHELDYEVAKQEANILSKKLKELQEEFDLSDEDLDDLTNQLIQEDDLVKQLIQEEVKPSKPPVEDDLVKQLIREEVKPSKPPVEDDLVKQLIQEEVKPSKPLVSETFISLNPSFKDALTLLETLNPKKEKLALDESGNLVKVPRQLGFAFRKGKSKESQEAVRKLLLTLNIEISNLHSLRNKNLYPSPQDKQAINRGMDLLKSNNWISQVLKNDPKSKELFKEIQAKL